MSPLSSRISPPTPARTVLVLGALCGLALVFVTPPFQVPDEPGHALRAYQISEGELAPAAGGVAVLPASLARVSAPFEEIPFHPGERVAPGAIGAALRVPLDPGRRAPIWMGSAPMYTPVPYLPQAAGALAGRTLGLGPLALLYLERLGNLAVCLLLAWTAVRLAPFAGWAFAFVALLPMALFLRSSASADALTGAAALLVACAALALAFGAEAERRRTWGLFAAGSAALVLSKGAYLLLPLAVLLVPPARFASRRRAALAYAGVALLVAAGLAASAWAARRGYVPLRTEAGVRPAEQARGVEREPLRFLALAAGDYVRHAPRYAAQLVGNLGWLDAPLPKPVLLGYALLLAGLAITGGEPARLALAGGAPAGRPDIGPNIEPNIGLGAGPRLLLAGLAAATLLLVSASQYLVWTPVGAAGIEGVQGRYLIPVAPFVVPLLGSRRWARDLSGPSASWLLFGAAALAGAAALGTVAARYYGPVG